MKNVLHIWRYYGQRSQTWLYRQLTSQTNYTPHLILKQQWLQNAHPTEFPFPKNQLHYFPHHNTIHRTLSRAATIIRTHRRDTFTLSDIHDINHLAQQIDAKIIHIHFGWTATQLLLHCSSFILHPSSFILSFYGSDVFRLSPQYKAQLIKILKTNIQIIATSHALKTGLIDLGANQENITVIPVGIDIEQLPSTEEINSHQTIPTQASDYVRHSKKTPSNSFAVRRASKTNAPPLKLFTVGRLIECKSIHKLPEIAQTLKEKNINFHWTVAGDGPLMPQCQQAIKQYGVEDCFTLTGSIPFKEVTQQMLNSDILVHNAIIAPDGSREALGVTLMEAGALGLPVISCNIGGIPEVIINNKTGILVKANQPEPMTNAIIKLANNPTLRHTMGQAAIQHIRKNFNAKQLAQKVEELYKKVLERF